MYTVWGSSVRAGAALCSVLLLACSSCASTPSQARDAAVEDGAIPVPDAGDAGRKLDAGALAFDAGPYAFSGGAPFALVPTASIVQVRAGGRASLRVLILRDGEFASAISIRASGLPREIDTGSARARTQDQAVTLPIAVPFGTRRGDHVFTVSGSAGGFIRSHRITLRVL